VLVSVLLSIGMLAPTPLPDGPLRVSGGRLVDAAGHSFALRGTQIDGLDLATAPLLDTARKRWNFNAIRLPVGAADCSPRLRETVALANRFDLVVILASDSDTFWHSCAAVFGDRPRVLFDVVDKPELVTTIRNAGAAQPVIVPYDVDVADSNVVRAVRPRIHSLRTDQDRDRLFQAGGAPLLAAGLDLELDSAACPEVPADPAAAAALVQSNLAYFDAHEISWIISSFRPGKLILSYTDPDASTLENGWTCGKPAVPPPGIGIAVQFHLFQRPIRGLFPIDSSTGGFTLARGGISIVYGPTLAREAAHAKPPLPTTLAGLSVEVTDSRGVARLARLLDVQAGWATLNFLVPEECATGPARITVVREDGSTSSAEVLIEDVVPSLQSALADGHGVAVAFAGSPRYALVNGTWRTIPIPIGRRPTVVRLIGMGVRRAPARSVQVCVGSGRCVPARWFGPGRDPGVDEILFEAPPEFAALGETDLFLSVGGQTSNVVRIAFSAGRAPPAELRPAAAPPLPPARRPMRHSARWPRPRIPGDNPLTAVKAELGRYLFYDERMSVNGAYSCASCHLQARAFTDGLPRAIGATGQSHERGAMSLVNVAYASVLNWFKADRTLLEQQARTPPPELGLNLTSPRFLAAVRADAVYRRLFSAAFPGPADPFVPSNIRKALASFERTIISFRSPYDRYHWGGQEHAISDSAQRGEVLFWLRDIGCFRCHSGFNFSDATDWEGRPRTPTPFHNTGVAPTGPARFKAPTLRNIALTAPYMHDGSLATLDAVLDHYAAGGRFPHPDKDPLLRPFSLTPRQRSDLLAFLESLTDTELLDDPRFADPWPHR